MAIMMMMVIMTTNRSEIKRSNGEKEKRKMIRISKTGSKEKKEKYSNKVDIDDKKRVGAERERREEAGA